MKQIFEIKEKEIIYNVLDKAEYGTLALCLEDKPYAVPVNFVRIEDDIYFHGALSNKKMKMLARNPMVSFSVVENYALIASYFSSTEGLACPATQFFKSVSIDGVTEIIKDRDVKAKVFEVLMQKHQPEGKYKPFGDDAYDNAIKATAVVKISVENICAKFKFGQHLNEERFNMILSHLEERNNPLDVDTIRMMKSQRNTDAV